MYHTYAIIYPFKVQYVLLFSLFTKLCSPHRHLVPEHFHHPGKKPVTLSCYPRPAPPHHHEAATNLLPVSVGWSSLDIAYKQDHATCGLLCLAPREKHICI